MNFPADAPKFSAPCFGLTSFDFGESENSSLTVVLVTPADIEFAPHYHNTDYYSQVMKRANTPQAGNSDIDKTGI